jgi:predicted amidohydrolase
LWNQQRARHCAARVGGINVNEVHLAALLVPRITTDLAANVAKILHMAAGAVDAGAALILLPEAVLTGLVNNDDVEHDLPLGQEIPGPVTAALAEFCRRRAWLGLGLLEREEGQLFDSAVLLNPTGEISLKYRRIQPQWHGRAADPAVYRQGSEVTKAETPFGTVSFLICGDLFDDGIVAELRDARPDLLLYPFARCFSPTVESAQQQWDEHEQRAYLERVALAGVPALMVNYIGDEIIGDDSFGGAFAVTAQGELMASMPLYEEGLLIVDLARLRSAP